MNRIIFLVLFVTSLAVFAGDDSPELPTNANDIVDIGDPKQAKRDKKTDRNFVKMYLSFRQGEKHALKIVDNTMTIAWNANRFLTAISTLAIHGQQVIENVKSFVKKDNSNSSSDGEKFKFVKKFVKTVEFLEEDVFQITDVMIENDLANITESWVRVKNSTKALAETIKDPPSTRKEKKENFKKNLKNSKEYRLKYALTMEMCAVKPASDKKFGYRPEYKMNMVASKVAADGIAGACDREQLYNAYKVINAQLLKLLQDTTPISQSRLAETKLKLYQNKLLIAVSENEVVHDGTFVTAMIGLQETQNLENSLINKAMFMQKTADEYEYLRTYQK